MRGHTEEIPSEAESRCLWKSRGHLLAATVFTSSADTVINVQTMQYGCPVTLSMRLIDTPLGSEWKLEYKRRQVKLENRDRKALRRLKSCGQDGPRVVAMSHLPSDPTFSRASCRSMTWISTGKSETEEECGQAHDYDLHVLSVNVIPHTFDVNM